PPGKITWKTTHDARLAHVVSTYCFRHTCLRVSQGILLLPRLLACVSRYTTVATTFPCARGLNLLLKPWKSWRISQPTAVATLACLLACVSRHTAVAVLRRVSSRKDQSQGPAATTCPERCHPMRNMAQTQRLQHRIDTHCLTPITSSSNTRRERERKWAGRRWEEKRQHSDCCCCTVGLTFQSCRCSKIDDGVALTTAAVHITRTDSPQQQHRRPYR
ncbi:unnamed protein product, partial [Ectocarpus sp. 13 AM-2016]